MNMTKLADLRALFLLPDRIQQFKAQIQTQQQNLKQQFDPHHSVRNLLNAKSNFIDNILSVAWEYFLADSAQEHVLCAVGGYGREELFPHSDVDVLILLNHQENTELQNQLSNFTNFLWDIGLKPGLSVRTLEECVKEARADQTVITSLLEIRLITGNLTLFTHFTQNIDFHDIWSSKTFFAAKMEEQQKRYCKFNDTAYSLEPNIKESPGGLRDLHIISWVFKYHYKAETLKELIKYDFMPESEYNDLIASRDILWQMRYALHLLTDKHEDRLLFDYQRELAVQFGFIINKQNQNIEQFMQFYFKTVVGLERMNEMLLQLFSERFVCPKGDCEVIVINDDFVEINGYLEARSNSIFQRNPLNLLEIFLILQKNTNLKGVRATTIRLIRKSLGLIDADFRNNPQANYLFIEILRQPHGITHQLRRMNRYGILAAYLPSFANIVARMQYDLFHIYTVDVHTLFVIGNLRRFALKTHQKELPFCYDVFKLVEKPEILYLAALFHDIAKGMGGNHSKLGEHIARDFCQQHALSEHDTKLITWLVRQHLLMSMTAQRKDISDPNVIYEFASQVKNIEYLNHLYLLTVADIRATSHTLWNSWKDILLQELYHACHSSLRRNLQNPVDINQRLLENKQEAQTELLQQNFTAADLEKIWQHNHDDYFLRYATNEIIWHTQAINSCNKQDLPLVLLRSRTQNDSTELFVYTKNEEQIFAICTASLDQLGLTILDARIMTTLDQYTLNSFQVIERLGDIIPDNYRKQHICITLRQNLLAKKTLKPINIHRQSRQAQHFPIKSTVSFHNDPLQKYTVIEFISTDSAGLLSRISEIFISLDIQLHNARITTIGSRAEDIFYTTNKHGNLLSTAQKQTLTTILLDKFT